MLFSSNNENAGPNLVKVNKIEQKSQSQVNELNDDILNLKVSELIWKKARAVFQNQDLIQIDLKFLKVLMKYGVNLNNTFLNNEIITNIKNDFEKRESTKKHEEHDKLKLNIDINDCILSQFKGRVYYYLS